MHGLEVEFRLLYDKRFNRYHLADGARGAMRIPKTRPRSRRIPTLVFPVVIA